MDVSYILPNLLNYEMTHLWPRQVVWITYVNKEVYESILSVCAKGNIEY